MMLCFDHPNFKSVCNVEHSESTTCYLSTVLRFGNLLVCSHLMSLAKSSKAQFFGVKAPGNGALQAREPFPVCIREDFLTVGP